MTDQRQPDRPLTRDEVMALVEAHDRQLELAQEIRRLDRKIRACRDEKAECDKVLSFEVDRLKEGVIYRHGARRFIQVGKQFTEITQPNVDVGELPEDPGPVLQKVDESEESPAPREMELHPRPDPIPGVVTDWTPHGGQPSSGGMAEYMSRGHTHRPGGDPRTPQQEGPTDDS